LIPSVSSQFALTETNRRNQHMPSSHYVIGVDYGTDSVRTVIIDSEHGTEAAASVHYYERWSRGMYCDAAANRFRQHPLDYVEGLEKTIKDCVSQVGPDIAQRVRAIGVDTTGSTPIVVDASGTPLAMRPEWSQNPNAMFVLWKDHTAIKEATEINRHAKQFDIDYLKFVGGIYSSEWFWAKWLHMLRVDESVREACVSFVEHCDWIPFLLTGGNDIRNIKRSVCAAGHKGLWAAAFNGYPPNSFFASLDPLLDGKVDSLGQEAYTSDTSAGTLSAEWATRLGLSEEVVVAVGAFDAHMGAVGGQIEPGHLSKVMGTSTCDILVSADQALDNRTVCGICGQVNGSVIPGMTGLEAGQSAFGDTYAWLRRLILDPVKQIVDGIPVLDQAMRDQINRQMEDRLIPMLSEQAAALPLEADDELAVDWFNGRRTPDANQYLTGSLHGLRLGTDAARVLRALVEATCFGAKRIIERFRSESVEIDGLIGLGGVARKSPYIMQVMSDVTGMPIRIHRSEQTCAMGAGMFAATAAGIYTRVEDAMAAMGQGFEAEYQPNADRLAFYETRYQKYLEAGAFTESHAPVQ
jgi:L-ribulokinase